jgi:HEAT repeat protein
MLEKTRSPKLKAGILAYFRKTGNAAAQDFAATVIADRDLYDQTLVKEAFGYLSEIRSPAALASAREIVTKDERTYLSAAIKMLGRCGGEDDAKTLISFLEGYPEQNYEQEAILALGELGFSDAAVTLERIVRDADKSKFSRAYACKSLAQIDGIGNVETILWAATVDDPIVRTAAVEALGAIRDPRAESALLDALRDPYVKVRIAAVKACGQVKLDAAFPALEYKARNDPEQAVKDEALKAIAEYGARGITFLASYYKEEKTPIGAKVASWRLIARKDPLGSSGFLTSTLEAAAADKDQALYKKLTSELFQINDPQLSYLIRRYLVDKDATLRMAALEWARRAKAYDLIPDIRSVSTNDSSEMVKKRALDVLDYLSK